MSEKNRSDWSDQRSKELKDEFLKAIGIKIPKEFESRLFNYFDMVEGSTVNGLVRFVSYAPREVQLEILDAFLRGLCL